MTRRRRHWRLWSRKCPWLRWCGYWRLLAAGHRADRQLVSPGPVPRWTLDTRRYLRSATGPLVVRRGSGNLTPPHTGVVSHTGTSTWPRVTAVTPSGAPLHAAPQDTRARISDSLFGDVQLDTEREGVNSFSSDIFFDLKNAQTESHQQQRTPVNLSHQFGPMMEIKKMCLHPREMFNTQNSCEQYN